MSSPRINNVIVVGAILIYIAGILLGIDGNFVSSDVEAILRCRVSSSGIIFVFVFLFVFQYEIESTFMSFVLSRKNRSYS